MYTMIVKVLRLTSRIFIKLANFFESQKSSISKPKIIKKGLYKNLYQTNEGIKLWLGGNSIIDKSIIKSGVWEFKTTELIRQFVKQDYVVIDIGANIGYFTTLFAKIVGENGKVYAFEPTNHYYSVLKENILVNNFTNIEIFRKGVSNKNHELEICIDDSSATLHQPIIQDIKSKEIITLTTLDEFVMNQGIKKIDFIKIDIDGHEPFVIDGAINTIKKDKPIIILEISHLHYYKAGITAWDFYDKLLTLGYHIYNEDDKSEILDKIEFLIKCGDFSKSTNIMLSKDVIY